MIGERRRAPTNQESYWRDDESIALSHTGWLVHSVVQPLSPMWGKSNAVLWKRCRCWHSMCDDKQCNSNGALWSWTREQCLRLPCHRICTAGDRTIVVLGPWRSISSTEVYVISFELFWESNPTPVHGLGIQHPLFHPRFNLTSYCSLFMSNQCEITVTWWLLLDSLFFE